MEFAFPAEVADVNQIPEDFRGFYNQAGDKHTLKDDAIIKSSVKTILGLSGSLKASRAEAKAAKGKVVDLTPLAEYGESPDVILQAIQKKIEEASTGGDAKAKANLEGIKKALQDAHGRELGTRDTRIKGLTEQLYKHLVDNAATAAIAELKGVPELLLPFVRTQIKVEEKDGAFATLVIDESGNQRFGSTGQPMTIKELVAGMKGDQKYGRLFESEAASGAGTPPGQKRTNHATQQNQRDQMTPTQKIMVGLAKGQALRPGR